MPAPTPSPSSTVWMEGEKKNGLKRLPFHTVEEGLGVRAVFEVRPFDFAQGHIVPFGVFPLAE